MSVLRLGEWDISKRMAVVSILYLSKLNYSLIILHFVLHWCSHTPEWTGVILLPNFSFVLCLDNRNALLFLLQNTMGILPSPPPSSENSQTAREKYKCTKRQAKQALCSALNHFLSQVQPLCIILPWLIEWVCADWGSWGRSDGVLSFGLHFMLPVGKRKFFAGIGCLVSFKF